MHVKGPGDKVRWARAESVLWRRVPGTVLLLSRDGDSPIALAGSGAALWDLLERPATESALVAALASTYTADQARVAIDVTRVLEELEEHGFVARTE